LLFEKEASFKTGFEAYYTSSQFLTDGFRTRAFWVLVVFGEKTFGKYSLFINFENITDTRQSRFTQVVFPHTGCPPLPRFTPTLKGVYSTVASKSGFNAPHCVEGVLHLNVNPCLKE